MSRTISLSAELQAALAIIPEASRDVKLRGHDVTLWPIETDVVSLWFFQDPQMAVAFVGIHIEGGKLATAEEIEAAREDMPLHMATKVILASTRMPELEPLIPNLTVREKSRLLNNAMSVTTGGDVAGFFADVRAEIEMLASYATELQSRQTVPPKKASRSTKGTRSSSSSRKSAS